MEPGQIVFFGKTKKGNDLTIRYPLPSDAQAMCGYINKLSKEKTFIAFQGEQMTQEEENKFLTSNLEAMKKQTAMILLAFVHDKLVGIADCKMKDKICRHQGWLGISIDKDYRGEGIGKILFQSIIDEAKKNLLNLEILILQVFANNPIARKMYQEFGFIEFAKLPNGIKLENSYVDDISMFLKVK